MDILIFLGILFILILVHEWGHFIVAKKTGMRVDEFGIGFPPKLFGWKKGETEYTLNALPIGGFVKILGENGEEPFSPVDTESVDGRSEPLSGEAGRGGSKSDADPRSFSSRPKWAQALVLVAGVTMNVILAWVVFAVIFMIGFPTAISEADATANSELMVTGILPDSPAAAAGIPATARILDLQSAGDDAGEVLTPSVFREFVESHDSVEITYRVGEDVLTTTLEPATGVIDGEEGRSAIGVSLANFEVISQPFHLALYDATIMTWHSLQSITVGLSSLVVDSFKGQADFSQVAGPVGIVGLVGDAAEHGYTSVLMFMAVISLNLAVINLLPFPALDGGRLLFVAAEAVMRRPVNPVWMARVNTVGFALLIFLMVAVTWNDILRLI